MKNTKRETEAASQRDQRSRRSILLHMGYLSLIDERRALLQTRRSPSYSIIVVPDPGQDHIVPYIPTSPETAKKMLELAQVKPWDTIYDLGCGDARILILAASLFKASKAVGYEINGEVYKTALKAVKDRNLEGKVTIINQDLFYADISEATVITLYLDHEAIERLRQKLEKETSHGTKIVSHDFEIHGWRPIKKEKRAGDTIYLYKVPESFEQVQSSAEAS